MPKVELVVIPTFSIVQQLIAHIRQYDSDLSIDHNNRLQNVLNWDGFVRKSIKNATCVQKTIKSDLTTFFHASNRRCTRIQSDEIDVGHHDPRYPSIRVQCSRVYAVSGDPNGCKYRDLIQQIDCSVALMSMSWTMLLKLSGFHDSHSLDIFSFLCLHGFTLFLIEPNHFLVANTHTQSHRHTTYPLIDYRFFFRQREANKKHPP